MKHEWMEITQRPIEVIATPDHDQLTTEFTGDGLTARGCGICGVQLDPDTFAQSCNMETPADISSLLKVQSTDG
jgi:hypothetical protein